VTDASVQAPPPAVEAARTEQLARTDELARHFAEMAKAFEPRGVDSALRVLDVVIAALVLLVTAPLLVLVALGILASSGRPVLYRGPRVGRAGEIFTMFKFRTLAPDAELRLGPFYGEELTRRTQQEVTLLGRALRATHFDELPQLLNVLRGDMALVGPRPIRPGFFEELAEEIPQYWQRLVVRPGVTGFAQLRITREETWAEKLAHDLEFIADRSVPLYLRAIAASMWRVLKRAVGRGA
jgi:lipopolysaccharide/colanic/teichoic acid biosynthesis glycosyltransferase